MRIGIITGEYPTLQGGVGAYTDVLSRVFADRGHDVFIFTEPRTKQQRADILLTQHDGWGIFSIRAMQKWVHENQLELVNLQFQTAAFNMSPVLHFLPHFINKPFLTTFHDLRFPYLFPKAGKLRDWIVLHLASASDGVIVTNHEDYARVQHLPCVETIPIGSNILTHSDTNFDKSARRNKAGAENNDFLLAYFGFINHSKGVDTLLHALHQLKNPNIKLVMIGGRTGTADPTNASYADAIDALVSELGLENQIHWTGYVDDAEVSNYLRASDAVVLPFRDGASFRRGSLMAAIQHNCAIITTKPNHPTSPFTDENMLLIPSDDKNALASAIETLYTSPSLRNQLQQETQKLKSLFDWQSIATQYETLFERVLGAR